MADIKLVDVSVRDGNQSNWGATGLNTPQILQIAPIMDRVGFSAIDFTSSTHMSVAVRYYQEDPWERIRLMRAAAPNTPLQFITTGMRFISWETADSDFMRLVYRRLVANGISRFVVLDPMHDIAALLEAARLVREEGGAEIMAALTYTLSDVHDDAFYAGCAAEIVKSRDVDRVYLKDPSGLLTPDRVRSLVPAIKAELGDVPLELHSHCTIGLAPFSYMAAAELGIDAMHTAVGPLANGSSLPAAGRLIDNLREMGHGVDIDDAALAKMTDYFSRLADAEGHPRGLPGDYDAAFLRHQIPGGVITTLKRQLEEHDLADRLPAVIDETERVRAELGYPIMVTPFPQIVCTQALMNVIGAERYAIIPDQVIRYVMGRFGRPTAPVAADIKGKILNSPRAREIEKEAPSLSLAEMRRKIGKDVPDDEFLLRAVMPADQIDAMKAAGPARRRYSPDVQPVTELIRQLTKRPGSDHIVVEKPGFRLELRRPRNEEVREADA